MRTHLERLTGAGRPAIPVIVGGLLMAVGAVLTWLELRAADVPAVDDSAVRTLLGIAVILVALGGAMATDARRRRLWPWAPGLAVLGFLGAVGSWLFPLLGTDPFSIRSIGSRRALLERLRVRAV